jgi:hypothetical protein
LTGCARAPDVRLRAHVPGQTTLSRALKFREGGILHAPAGERELVMSKTPSSDALIKQAGREWCSQCPAGVLIFWNYMHRPDDPVVRRSGTRWFRVGDEVYYFVACTESGDENVEAAMSQSMSTPNFLVCTTKALDKQLPRQGATADPALIASLAANCRSLYMLAYDGEAYISAEFAE